MGESFVRINEEDKLCVEELDESGFVLRSNNNVIRYEEIKSVWYRRGRLTIDIYNGSVGKVREFLVAYNNAEAEEIVDYIYMLLKKKRHLNDYINSSVNKLKVLSYGKENNLNMPPFLITQTKKELLKFYLENKGEILSKPIGNVMVLRSEDGLYSSFTHKLQDQDMEYLPSKFVPTFFQKYIEKKIEIRTFYLDGDFFSMVIFSQQNPKTKIDFRRYDSEKSNRTSPYKLPEFFRKKISNLMLFLDINCASIDVVLSSDDMYYLLDVNPIGQFGMTSKPCNYNLEKKVATFLSKVK